jgi:cyanophycinase
MEDRRTKQMLAGLAWAGVALAGSAVAQTPLPSHGPAKGYLVITGGQPDYDRMIALAGGKAAHVVVIPTAAITKPEDEKMLPPYCTTIFAGMKCTVLHTTDRKVADSPEFAAPLKDATGVYLEGGRHWRLADAYLGTLTLKEIFGVLDRGGVVMGGSAGATIQGSYMVRGSSNPDDNTIMMAPGHEVGFGLITNAIIDQHVDARDRENDLAPVMKKHPELLGIGLDQSTSITVHGDTLTCNGPRRAAIWDGKDHDGKGYYFLQAGDTLNLVTHVATLLPHAPFPWDNPTKPAAGRAGIVCGDLRTPEGYEHGDHRGGRSIGEPAGAAAEGPVVRRVGGEICSQSSGGRNRLRERPRWQGDLAGAASERA